jgi:hypothetical protein
MIFRKKVTENKMSVLISLQIFSETFLILRKIQHGIIITVHRSFHVMILVFLSHFHET